MSKQTFSLAAAILAAATILPACVVQSESDAEEIGAAEEAVGGTGHNNVNPKAVDIRPLRRSITDSYDVTSSSNANPRRLCKASTITASGCEMTSQWEDWLNGDADRGDMMKGIAKCAVEPGFSIQTSDGSTEFPGQWGLYQDWKDSRLTGLEARERMSACILTLLNGDNQTLAICIVGPGGSPFSDACSDPNMTLREGGFFGNLFATAPKAYVVGPSTTELLDNGRVCTSSVEEASYCCSEDNTTCPHWIVKAGSMEGPNARCNAFETVSNGSTSFTYCTEFFSTREPNKVYTNGFTTFVPSVQ
jgi:hypothetical protein